MAAAGGCGSYRLKYSLGLFLRLPREYVFYFNFIRVLKILVSGFNDVLFYVKIARFVVIYRRKRGIRYFSKLTCILFLVFEDHNLLYNNSVIIENCLCLIF